jgi:hypothetical protein
MIPYKPANKRAGAHATLKIAPRLRHAVAVAAL